MTHTTQNVKKIDGEWWYMGQKDGRRRLKAHRRKNNTRMFVDGKYIPKSHPLHRPGRYNNFEEAAFSSLKNYKSSKKGEVYILVNPAYPDWVKVGMAVDANDRLKGYQTSSPFRDFQLIHVIPTNDRRVAEAEIHRRLSAICPQRGEWFQVPVSEAIEVLQQYDAEEENA